MFLFLDQNFPEMLGDGIFTQRFTLTHAFPIVADGFVFIVQKKLLWS